MADKFTPYALTALPAAQDRDVNGIYFIRTATGMEVYAIANTPTRDADPLKVEGYVNLTSTQNIAGRKIFDVAIGVDGYIIIPIYSNSYIEYLPARYILCRC